MDDLEKLKLLSFKEILLHYSNGYNLLINNIKNIDDELLVFRPPINDAWTIKEHLIHLVDSEINLFLRVKFSISETGKEILVINEDLWNDKLNYNDENLDDYLDMFRLIRKIITNLLKNIDDEKSKEYFVIHPEFGKLDLKNLITIYAGHISSHIEFINRNIKIWKEK
jgi:hypothetical protein